MKTRIKNCRILRNGKLSLEDIFINDGKFSSDFSPPYCEIDASGMIILPGAIDAHVHMREPGQEYKEDFLSGSRAGIKGGTTCFLDMPNNLASITTTALLADKRAHAKKSIADYGFHFGAADNNCDEIKKAENIASVKCYMTETTGGLILSFPGLERIMQETDAMLSIHVDDIKMLDKILALSLKYEKRIHICHVSKKEELMLIEECKKSNKNLSCEVTPHHLFLSEKNKYMVKPPLNKTSDSEYLWEGAINGSVDIIATDHAPHTRIERDSGMFYGIPGIETRMPLMLDYSLKGKISMKRVVELCCTKPAEIYGIKNKGEIKEEYDADFFMFNPEAREKIKEENLETKCRWSPFNRMNISGRIEKMFLRGNLSYERESGFSGNPGKEISYFS
ncbi:MAG: dihydroorotase family protein [Candidatus Woesearchaeota archaeon]|nr:dihydroorotase family protein [Candidatus Woesearchaeota archaeon]